MTTLPADFVSQNTTEWRLQRLGLPTASRVRDIMAKTKTGPAASRAAYMAILVAEQLTGTPAESYTNASMVWGTDHEDEGRFAYEMETGETVEEVGFVHHPTLKSGASPDGLVGDDGIVEIKCPNTHTHITTLLDEKVPKKYITQMQWQLACTGRKWADFVSYDPRLPLQMRVYIRRIKRDDAYIKTLTEGVEEFIIELDDIVAKLKNKFGDN
jgi:putative phage-type endonuclease